MNKKKSTILAVSNKVNLDRIPSQAQPAKATKKLSDVIAFLDPDNTTPQQLVGYYERSPTHRTALNIKTIYTVGKGFVVKRKDDLPYEHDDKLEGFLRFCNFDNESLYDVFVKSVLDWNIVGNNSLLITKKGDAINVFHQDVTTLRKSTAGAFYYSDFWEGVKSDGDVEILDKLPPYVNMEKDGKSILYNMTYSPARKFYGLPSYYSVGALEWINIEYDIPRYNEDRIKNGFMPSAAVTLFGSPPEGMSANEYLDEFIEGMTGRGNVSKIVAQIVDSKDQAPDIQQFTAEPDGIFETLQELAVANILRAHNLHPRLLMATAGSLGESQDVRTIYEIYMNTVIMNTQKLTLRMFNRILNDLGFGQYYLEIEQISPVSLIDMVGDAAKYMSENEIRQILGLPLIDSEDKDSVSIVEKSGSGAVTAMLAILSNPAITNEQKVSTIEVMFGLSNTVAQKLVNNEPVNNTDGSN